MNKRKLINYYTLIALFFAILLSSCSTYGYQDYAYGVEEEAEALPQAIEMNRMADFAMSKESAPQPMASSVGSEAPVSEVPTEKPGTEEQRKRIYNGAAGLVVEDPPETRKELEETAVNSGGYVEQSYADYLVLRVPAEKFNDIFNSILLMGTVKYQQIDTWDVSDQYQDTEARLTTAEETRRRLYVLLEKSTDPKETG